MQGRFLFLRVCFLYQSSIASTVCGLSFVACGLWLVVCGLSFFLPKWKPRAETSLTAVLLCIEVQNSRRLRIFLFHFLFLLFGDIAGVVRRKYPHSKAPTAVMPTWVLYLLASISPVLTKDNIKHMAGRHRLLSSQKAKEELGLEIEPPERGIMETVESLIDLGVVKRPPAEAPSWIPSFFRKGK